MKDSIVQDIPLLILAGGMATRLGDIAKDRPKYLTPISPTEAFADVHLRWVAAQGFKNVILSIGHLGEQIRSYCGDGKKWGLDIHYLPDGPFRIGTGGAVRKSLAFDYQYLAVTYGDTLLKFSVENFLKLFLHSRLRAGMTVYKNDIPGHITNCSLVNNLVHYEKSHPKPDMAYIDYGFLVLQRQAVESFVTETPLDLALPLGFLSRINQVFGFETKHRFWEIGSPDSLMEFVQNHLQ